MCGLSQTVKTDALALIFVLLGLLFGNQMFTTEAKAFKLASLVSL